MKTLFLSLFISFAFLIHGQTPDTAQIRLEIDSLVEVNKSLINQRDFDGAFEAIELAQKKCLNTFGEETARYGAILFNKGRTCYFSGDNPNAEKYYAQSKDIREKTIGKLHPDYAWSVNNLATMYYIGGQFEKAQPLYLEALEIREKVLGREHPDYATTMEGLAVLYMQKGQFEKAEPLALEAKAIRKKVYGDKHPHYAISLNNLANLYKNLGAYEKAELFYYEAKEIWKIVLGSDHPHYAASLNNLANLYSNIGNYKKAEPLFLESKDIREKALGKEHLDFATSLNNLANLYKDMKQYEKAEPLYKEARSTWKKVLGDEHPLYALSLSSLATLYRKMGQAEKSEPLYLEAIAIQEKVLGKENPDYAVSLNNLADLYKERGNYGKAEPLYLESIAILEKVVGKTHPDYAANLNSLANLYYYKGGFEKAEPIYLEANDIEKTLLIEAASYLSERELLLYIYKFIDSQNEFLSFLETHGKQAESAYDNTLFYKGFLLNATQQVSRLAQTDSTSKEMFLQLKAYNRQLAVEYTKPLKDREDVVELEEKANSLEKELARSIADFGKALRQVSWQEVQKTLQPEEAAVEFIDFRLSNPAPTDKVRYAALILKNTGSPKLIPLFEEKSLDSLFVPHQERRSDYVNDLYSLNDRGLTVDENPSKSLYQLIWEPLAKDLENIKTIYCSPTGLLHRINLNAIPVAAEKTIADLYNLVQLQSTRSLAIGNAEMAINYQAVLYGGIQYEPDSLTIAVATENSTNETFASRGPLNIDTSETNTRGGTWNYLQWTHKEVEAIRLITDGTNFNTLLYHDYTATEESFRNLGKKSPSPRVLHVATHGFFFPDPDNKAVQNDTDPIFKTSDNPMIRSGIILAGGNHVWRGNPPLENMEDGILTAYEISQMDLSHTELVVLSACETGLGDIEGNEGVYGLQRAFKIAGAKYLIMSLWQVPDRQTKDFMVTFYQHWLEDQMTIPDAFRKTQQEMKERFYDPYQWAGFVLVE